MSHLQINPDKNFVQSYTLHKLLPLRKFYLCPYLQHLTYTTIYPFRLSSGFGFLDQRFSTYFFKIYILQCYLILLYMLSKPLFTQQHNNRIFYIILRPEQNKKHYKKSIFMYVRSQKAIETCKDTLTCSQTVRTFGVLKLIIQI